MNHVFPKIRLLIISNSPGPNQNDFFRELSIRKKIDLKVLYMGRRASKWQGSEPHPSYPHEFLINIIPFTQRNNFFFNPGIIARLILSNYDYVVIQGYFMPSSIISMILLSAMRKKWIFWGEMVNRSQDKEGLGYILKKLVVGRIINNNADFILAIGGDKAKESYLHFGCTQEKIRLLPYSCNLNPYYNLNQVNLKALSSLKDKYKSSGEKIIFSLGQLIPRKCIDILIKAFIQLDPIQNNFRLLIGGDGPKKEALKQLVPRNIDDRVDFLGFLPKKDQPPYYSVADLFVLPSKEDGWGMVIAEALASGTPVVSTTGVLSTYELIDEGYNGFLVKPNDVSSLSEAIIKGFRLAELADGKTICRASKICHSKYVARQFEKVLREFE